MDDDYVFNVVNEAIDLLPQGKLLKLVKRYLDPSELEPDGEASTSITSSRRSTGRSERRR